VTIVCCRANCVFIVLVAHSEDDDDEESEDEVEPVVQRLADLESESEESVVVSFVYIFICFA